jgi:hypothetical protein
MLKIMKFLHFGIKDDKPIELIAAPHTPLYELDLY